MSILNIDENSFNLTMLDYMEDPNRDLEVDIWAEYKPGQDCGRHDRVSIWNHNNVLEILKRILKLNSIKPTGREIRKILKDVIGVDLSVRVHKYMFRQERSVYAFYDIAANSARAFADRICRIDVEGTPYRIQSIRININYPKMNIPAEGLKF